MKIFLLTLSILAFSIGAQAKSYVSKCEKFPALLIGEYCIHTPTGTASKDFVYYLHGRGGDNSYWQEDWYYTRQIQNEWQKTNQAQPIVISLSFGPVWLLANKNSSPYSGLLDVVTQQIIPSIEKQLGGLKGRRLVFGESMGGFNTIQLALKTELFAKAAILCSPMSELSPFSPMDEIENHVKQSSAWHYYENHPSNPVLDKVKSAMQSMLAVYPTAKEWETGDPLQLANIKRTNYPELYVAVGFYDEFASYEANEKFVATLTSNNAKVEWHPQWGGHCAMDITSLAKFLIQ